MTKGELRAQEYRARARDAWDSVEAATLDHVREQRRRSAATWTQMAEAEETRALAPRGSPSGIATAADEGAGRSDGSSLQSGDDRHAAGLGQFDAVGASGRHGD